MLNIFKGSNFGLKASLSASFKICNYLAGSLSGPKSPIFRHTSQFFYSSAATAYKKSLRLAKNGFFFVSDATG
jgi:hypothetical protein